MLIQRSLCGLQSGKRTGTDADVALRLPRFERCGQDFNQRPTSVFVNLPVMALVADFVADVPQGFLQVLGRCAFAPVPENVLERIATIERQMARDLDALDARRMSGVVGGVVYGVGHCGTPQ